jgi:hypothetical protein
VTVAPGGVVVVLFRLEDSQSCQPWELCPLLELDNGDLREVEVASTTVVLVLVVEVKLPRGVEDSQSCHP